MRVRKKFILEILCLLKGFNPTLACLGSIPRGQRYFLFVRSTNAKRRKHVRTARREPNLHSFVW